MNKTGIEWVKNPDGTQGYTWNPITGCLNGCSYCYARKLANTRLRVRYIENMNIATPIPHDRFLNGLAYGGPFYPRFWEDRVKQMALYAGTGKGIFTCDMSDLFGIGVPTEWTEKVLFAINLNRRNRFYLLTKQPQNLPQWSPFPPNCWVGVTATSSDMFDTAFRYLMLIDAKVKYISFEPLLDWTRTEGLEKPLKHIDWVIIGAQTKPTVMPKIEWVEEIIDACSKAGVKVFLKDNLMPLFPMHRTLGQHLRQEMPDANP